MKRAATGGDERFVFMGYRRGGSSIAFAILQELLNGSNLRSTDIVKKFHDQGIATCDIPAAELQRAVEEHSLIGVFREEPHVLKQVSGFAIRPILLVRDPRDCWLSWMFARNLHVNDSLAAVPLENVAVTDDKFTEEDNFDHAIADLFEFARDNGGLILKYEDLVCDPVAFLIKVLSFTAFRAQRDAVDTALVSASFVRLTEDSAEHQRLGNIYSAVTTLPRGDIARLNARFGRLIKEFGYPLWPEDVPMADVNRMRERDAIKRFILKLAEENALRIQEIAILKEDLATRIAALERENGFRIEEIRRLGSRIAGVAEE